MRTTPPNPKVDEFIQQTKAWQEEFKALRKIIQETSLTETLKWGVPCYTLNNNNVVLIHGFKEYCALLFIKGVLLKDSEGILVQQTSNVQAGRQLRFTSQKEILEQKKRIVAFLEEAIKIQESGIEVPYKKTLEFPMPEELEQKFIEVSGLKEAFLHLTPGRQRAYLLFFSAPKQSKTKVARIDKALEAILHGKGLGES